MSLYDGLDVDTDSKKNVSSSSNKPDVSGWSAGIRMMQSQLRLKKAALTEAQRKIRGATLAPVVDLKKGKGEDETRLPSPRNQMSPRRPVHGPPRTVKPSPFVAGVIGDITGDVTDEYDPAYPNEYEKMQRKVREKRQRESDNAWEKGRGKDDRRRRDRGRDRDRDRDRHRDRDRSPQGFSRKPDSDEEEERDKTRRRGKQGAAIAPPSSLLNESEPPKDSFVAPAPIPKSRPYASILKKQENDPERSTTPPPGSEFSEMEDMPEMPGAPKSSLAQGPGGFSIPVGMGADSVAAKIMAKYGFKSGRGLGKKEQGISTALVVEKTSRRGGKIIEHGKDVDIDMPAPSAMPLPKQPTPASELSEAMKNPTKVVLLRNMVGPGEVDDELQPETAEECTKYGEVIKCIIYEEPHAKEDEAVRIFVEFGSIAAAVKAVVDLNGRFFGGRVVKASFFNPEKFKRFELGIDA